MPISRTIAADLTAPWSSIPTKVANTIHPLSPLPFPRRGRWAKKRLIDCRRASHRAPAAVHMAEIFVRSAVPGKNTTSNLSDPYKITTTWDMLLGIHPDIGTQSTPSWLPSSSSLVYPPRSHSASWPGRPFCPSWSPQHFRRR